MPDKEGVNVLDSLDDNQDGKSPDEGKKSQDELEKKVRENLRAEYERKANEKIEAEKARISQEFQDRIAELEDKNRLTPKEETELEGLKKSVYKIKSDPQFRPWDEIIRETIREEMEAREESRLERQHKEGAPLAQRWLEEKAEENKMTLKDLVEEIKPFLEDRYLDKLPTERVRLAYETMQRIKEKYSKGTKEDKAQFAEGEGRQMRKMTPKEGIKEARVTDNWKNILGAVAESQTSKEK